MSEQRAIGLMGGTFDPIHNGHLRCALEVHHLLGLEQTFLLPNAIPPHKDDAKVNSSHRLNMVKLATEPYSELNVDARELNRSAPSYTVETLETIRAERPRQPLCFIIGMDSLLTLPQWRKPERILELAHLVVCHRPGFNLSSEQAVTPWLQKYQCDVPAKLHAHPAGLIFLQQVTQLEISSSEIRHQIASGLQPHFLMPRQVVDYIGHHQLYRHKHGA